MKLRISAYFLIAALIVALSATSYAQVTMTYDIASQCSQLAGRYRLFGTINAGSRPEAAIFDWNRNGKMNIVLTRTNITPNRTEIYEFDGIDSLGMAKFNTVHTFPVYFSPLCGEIPCPPYVIAIGDLTNNRLMNLIFWSPGDTLRIYEQPDSTAFPLQQRLSRLFRTNYVTQGEVRDFNNDGTYELLVNHQNSHTLYKYQSIDSSLALVWRDSVRTGGNDTYNYGRYAIGDFDGDGYLEFAGGNSYPGGSNDAFVFVYKRTGHNQFALSWSDTIEGIVNLWVHGACSDLDNNGKVEFWVGGYTYTDRTLYKFFMYETAGSNNYDSVFVLTVRLPYLGTASVGEIAFGDVDGDGGDEIALSTGDYVLILKPRGPRDFEPIACIPTGTGDSEVWLKDIDGDGRAEIIISRWFYGPPQTWFYKYDGPTGGTTIQGAVPSNIELMQNYPNPFNSTTHIRYSLPARLQVQLSLYNILGQRVALLVNATQEAGDHKLEIDSDRYMLTSGIYFLRLITPTASVFRKIIVLR